MFNKRSCLVSWMVVLLLCVLSSVAICDYPTLVNPSFEKGNTSGWKEVYGTDIYPSDENAVQWWEPYAVSEISPDGKAPDGDWYMLWLDDGLYQITEETIGDDEVYHVSVDACQSWNAVIVKVDLGYEEGPKNYIVEATETFYPTRRLEWVGERLGVMYVGTWERFSLDYIPSFNAKGKPFYIKVGNEDVGEWLAIDNVQLGCYKDYVTLVYPPDGAKNIPVEAVMEWTLDEGFVCDAYFGTHPDPNLWMNEQVIVKEYETTYDPDGDLEYDTTYYWRVDSDPNGFISYAGKWWSFTTVTKVPVVVDGPYSQTADVVTLTVEAAGLEPFTSYQWYKAGDPDTLYAITTEPSVTIDVGSDMSLEGYYYCTVTNDYGTSEPSESARVMQPRLAGWWKFDDGDNFTDSVADEVPGAPVHDGAGSVDGFVERIGGGDAAYFAGTGKTVTISDSVDYFNFYPEGMTVCAWVNCELDGTWDGFISKQSNNDDWWIVGWILGIDDFRDRANFSVRNPERDLFGTTDDGTINDGDWHLVAGAIEPDYSERTCRIRVFVDGALRDTSEALDMASVLPSPYEVVIGNSRTGDADSQVGSFHGKVDDVRIYNYPLEEMDIAMMYLEHNEGITVCVDQTEPWRQFDVAGEPGEPSFCKVDIEDLAEFASAWMKCNLLRDCL